MYHVMFKSSDVIVCNSWDDVKEKQKKGYEIYSGSGSEKSALEAAERLKQQKNA